jgi:plasmid rolling circle replication initiator protein Rep
VKGSENVIGTADILYSPCLQDRSATGRLRNWDELKQATDYLGKVYQWREEDKRAERLYNCAWEVDMIDNTGVAGEDGYGDYKYHYAHFCRSRLCPLCTWRRSLKTYSQVAQLTKILPRQTRYIFCTLTVQNCPITDINPFFEAFNRLTKTKELKAAFSGYFRAFEMTIKQMDGNGVYWVHPHFHVLFACKETYFGRDYIPTMKMRHLWQQALGCSYLPRVDMRITQRDGGAIAEIAKYTVKMSDYISGDFGRDADLTAQIEAAMKKKRAIGFGGVFRSAHKRLEMRYKLTHPESGKKYIPCRTDGTESAPCEQRVNIIKYVHRGGAYVLHSVIESKKGGEDNDIVASNAGTTFD